MKGKVVSEKSAFKRLPTGIRGFDTLLCGGFLQGGVYLIMGAPGAGKTIIANQLAFHHVSQGERALYVTLLAETHSRMFGNMQSLEFFDAGAISDSLNYLGGYGVLEKQGLEGLLKMLGEAIRKFKATMIFIDGIASIEDAAETNLSFKKFVHQLNSVLSTSGCTTFLLSSLDTGHSNPEHTMVDGIVSLSIVESELRDFRQIQVRKFRGSNHLKGRHLFRIDEEGVTIFPRIESFLSHPFPTSLDPEDRLRFGIPKLDQMLRGGLIRGTTTSLLGPAGTGKSSLGAHFLAAGAQNGEGGLYYGFYEGSNRWATKMEKIDIPLNQYLKSGKLTAVWRPEPEINLDEVLADLLAIVREKDIQRVFLDGVGGLREGMFGNDHRLHRALAAFSNELRSLGATTLFTEETELFASEVSAPISDLSAVTDNVIFLRQVEIESELRRYLSVIKIRESDCDRQIHELFITQKGIVIGDSFRNVQALMSGFTETRATSRKAGTTHQHTRPQKKGSTRKSR